MSQRYNLISPSREKHCNSHVRRQKYPLKVKATKVILLCKGKVFFTHVTLFGSRLQSEKSGDNTVVSEDDFQFPSAKYEIIVLPILPAKLQRQGNTTAKSSVCYTRNETVTSLYSLITEINLQVDTETLVSKQASKSHIFQIISYA